MPPSCHMPRDNETSCALRDQGEGSPEALFAGSHILGPLYLLWKNSGSPKGGLGTQRPTHPPQKQGPSNPRAAVPPKSFPFLFPLPESWPPRDLDLEVFCDSVEQLEPELVRLPVLSPVPAESELSHLPPGTWDSTEQVWAEQKEAAARDLDTRSSPESPGELPSLTMLLVP